MSDLDELFNSIVNNVTVNVLRDSAIILVNEGDTEHPLKTGEYFFDEENNTLYVGGYVPERFYFWQFIKHSASVNYIPAPRIKSSVVVTIPTITHSQGTNYKPAPKLSRAWEVPLPTLEYSPSTKRTTKVQLTKPLTVTLPQISHESEVI